MRQLTAGEPPLRVIRVVANRAFFGNRSKADDEGTD